MIDMRQLRQEDSGAWRDILEYCKLNSLNAPETEFDCLDFWLQYNGIIGYTARILGVIKNIHTSVK